MKTLIIYDNDGYIVQQVSGSYRIPSGMQYLEAEIPSGRYAASIDVSVTPNVVILNVQTVDPVILRLTELERRLNVHDEQIIAVQDISYMSLECAVQVYEEVLPFLP